jgi:uncharacterized Zn-binding protein involved in type VI secretion
LILHGSIGAIRRAKEGNVYKAAVRHGDPTTTRGVVFAFSSTIDDDGKKVALSGDEATCGNCEGMFKIFGTGKGMSENGRDVVVEGDLVLCPCRKNRVIVGSNPGIFLEADRGAGTAIGVQAVAASTSPSASPSPDELEHYFEIVDAMTNTPIEGMTYKLVSDGTTLVDDQLLVAGKTKGYSKDEHPDLTLIAWRAGDVR